MTAELSDNSSRLVEQIAADCDISSNQMRFIRIVFGLFACYAGTIFVEQYWTAHNGKFFNLPMIPGLVVPSIIHRAILVLVFLLGVCLFANKRTPLASFLLSLCFAYILISDHFGFRHVWVLLGNIYLIFAIIAIRRPIFVGEKTAGSPCVQQYALLALRLYIALAYMFAAVAKMDAGFMSGAILQQLVSNWGEDSLIKSTLDGIPWSYKLMAVSALIAELILPFALIVPRLRPLAITVGFFFHNAVPFIGWVGHSLNFYFVGSYLFFCGNPRQPRASSWFSPTSLRNPCIAWYVAIWFLMLALKIKGSWLYIGVLLLSGWELLDWITRPRQSRPRRRRDIEGQTSSSEGSYWEQTE